MAGPAWLAAALAALMLTVAACCTARLAIWRLRGRGIEPDADGVHVLMGVAMAGMLEPRLSPFPGAVWQAVFAAAAAWFGWRAIRARGRPKPGGWRCTHPAPHAVECAAMIYMLLPGRAPAPQPAMSMPAMGGPAAANPALAVILALFMVGYVLWTTDQLATISRDRAAEGRRARLEAPGSADSRGPGPAALLAVPATTALAPRFAAGYKIAMSVAMAYMLITMF